MDDLRKAYRMTVFVGLSMMTSLLIYLIVATVVERQVSMEVGDVVFYIGIGISAALFFVVRIVTGAMLGPGGERTGSASAAGGPPIAKLQTAAIVTFAICEVPAVLGLVLYFLGRSMTDFYLFLLISLFCFATYFPRFGQWEEWFRQQGGGTRR